MSTADGGGWKLDQDKVRLELLPPELLMQIGAVLTFGAKKYGDRNWERGLDWSRAYAALLRHMLAWWSGEDNDPETGMSHLAHAGCCLAFLIAYTARPEHAGRDDRPGKARHGGAQRLTAIDKQAIAQPAYPAA